VVKLPLAKIEHLPILGSEAGCALVGRKAAVAFALACAKLKWSWSGRVTIELFQVHGVDAGSAGPAPISAKSDMRGRGYE
jgi:hypothetical protein